MEQTFFVAGGDARQQAIVKLLKKRGCDVGAFGFAPEDRLTPALAAQIGAADVVLLPLPAAGEDTKPSTSISSPPPEHGSMPRTASAPSTA